MARYRRELEKSEGTRSRLRAQRYRARLDHACEPSPGMVMPTKRAVNDHQIRLAPQLQEDTITSKTSLGGESTSHRVPDPSRLRRLSTVIPVVTRIKMLQRLAEQKKAKRVLDDLVRDPTSLASSPQELQQMVLDSIRACLPQQASSTEDQSTDDFEYSSGQSHEQEDADSN